MPVPNHFIDQKEACLAGWSLSVVLHRTLPCMLVLAPKQRDPFYLVIIAPYGATQVVIAKSCVCVRRATRVTYTHAASRMRNNHLSSIKGDNWLVSRVRFEMIRKSDFLHYTFSFSLFFYFFAAMLEMIIETCLQFL